VTDLRDRPDALDECPVELVSWPSQSSLREALARVGVPRVLLVEPDAEPPASLGIDEDWVRMPANDADVLARAVRLTHLAAHLRSDEPYVDDHRVLHRAGVSIPLNPTESAMLTILLRHRGAVVSVAELEREVWRGSAQSRDAVDAAMYRLRRRLSGLHLVIRSVRNRGFVIDVDHAA
jgi:DNA-binding response OmpR family regulator